MGKEYKFSFVILNYKTTHDTIECVESIKENCKGYDFHIVIVDNASPNQSGKRLMEIYQNNPIVKVILSNENLGFARGNNLGFEFAKKELHPDFIILCNSDTKILDSQFCQKVIQKYQDSDFAVLGPKERLVDGSYYPLQEKVRSKVRIKLDIDTDKNILKTGKRTWKYRVFNRFYNTFIKSKRLDTNKEYENIVLHGAFLIFSEKYIELFDGLNPVTFFYVEEEFLALRLQRKNLKSIYYPEIEILHKRKAATNTMNETEKNKFVLECQVDSNSKLLDALNGKIEV